jgi:hypothetical protein
MSTGAFSLLCPAFGIANTLSAAALQSHNADYPKLSYRKKVSIPNMQHEILASMRGSHGRFPVPENA